MFEEQNRIVMVSDRKAVLELGAKNWPLSPFPSYWKREPGTSIRKQGAGKF